MAAALNLDSAFGIADKVPDNGRTMRNLILGAAHISDHILHFYRLAALDYVDVTAVASYNGNDPVLHSVKGFVERGDLGPFFPRLEGDYRLSREQMFVIVLTSVKEEFARRRYYLETAMELGSDDYLEKPVSPQELLDVREEKPDLIILDIIMPTKDGFMVCEELKKDPQLSKIPVMLLTSLSSRIAESTVSVTQALTTEAEDYVDKPVNPEELFRRVERLLKKRPRKGR